MTPFRANPRTGVVYTRPNLVGLTLDLAGYRADRDLSQIRVLDVGCGYGQFIGEVARRLTINCRRLGKSLDETRQIIRRNIRGIEVNSRTADEARRSVLSVAGLAHLPPTWPRRGPSNLIVEGDFLAWDSGPQRFDLVVGNLPYVKYEVISRLARRRRIGWIRQNFDCFTGRADYSVAFFQRILRLLSPNGRTALITSNRFTQAEYGAKLRQAIVDSGFDIDEVDLRDVRAFDQKVWAYASLFLLNSKGTGKAHYIRLHSLAAEPLAQLVSGGLARLRSNQYYSVCSRGPLPPDGSSWSPLPAKINSLLKRISREFPQLDDSGFLTRVGPATGADDVFIRRENWFPFKPGTKREYLLPVFTGEDPFASEQGGGRKSILSLYTPDTQKLISFDALPSDVQRYLRTHRDALRQRHIVRARNRPWWDTIDPVDPTIVGEHKLIVRDLMWGERVFLDAGHFFPPHTVTYTLGPKRDLVRLQRIFRSPLADAYRTAFSPSLKGGAPRAASNVLSRFPFPSSAIGSVRLSTDPDFEDVYDAYHMKSEEVSALTRYWASNSSA